MIPAVTGVSPRVVEELLGLGGTEMIVRSANNLDGILRTRPGDVLFVTSTGKREVREGTLGVIAEVTEVEVVREVLVASSGGERYERETTAARVRLKTLGVGRVVRYENKGVGRRMEVEVELEHVEPEAY
ncbi:MAG: DUF473 domain-containing protein [Methanopyri archaeon]|nr:DUF473 domain-containing protein [Methanopyri archaeon]